MVRDPVIHRVAAHHADLRHLAAHARLQHRIDVRQKEILAVRVLAGNLRLERLEDIQVGAQRLRLVQVARSTSRSSESSARCALDATRIDAAPRKHRLMLGQKIFADHRDHAHIGEVAGRQRKMRRRTAQAVVHRPCGVSMLSNATDPTTRIDIIPFRFLTLN